jgi:hypothetical protein
LAHAKEQVAHLYTLDLVADLIGAEDGGITGSGGEAFAEVGAG